MAMLLSHRRAWAWGPCLSLSLSLYGSVAAAAEPDAGTRAAARTLAEDGVNALQNGDAATAVQKLEKAHRALQAPSVALWSARALAKLGLLVEARERYIEATRLPISGDKAVQEQARLDAQTESEQLEPRIPSLLISVAAPTTPGLSVTVDGTPLPELLLGEARPTNPGPHRIVATRGAEQASEAVTLAEGEHRRLELKLAVATGSSSATPPGAGGGASAEPAKSGSVAKTLGVVAIVAGGAGLVTGGVTGLMAVSKKKALDGDARCRDGQCLYSAQGDVNSLRTFRTLSTVGLVAGGVLAAVGVTLLFTAPAGKNSEQTPQVSLTIGPANARLQGTF